MRTIALQMHVVGNNELRVLGIRSAPGPVKQAGRQVRSVSCISAHPKSSRGLLQANQYFVLLYQ